MKPTTEQAIKILYLSKGAENGLCLRVDGFNEALQMGADALALREKIKDILFTHRYTDYDCVMEIAKLIGIYAGTESDN